MSETKPINKGTLKARLDRVSLTYKQAKLMDYAVAVGQPSTAASYLMSMAGFCANGRTIEEIQNFKRILFAAKRHMRTEADVRSFDFDNKIHTRVEGEIMRKLMQQYQIFSNAKALVPDTKNFTPGDALGIEIECAIPMSKEEIQAWLNVNKKKLRWVRCGSDGSIAGMGPGFFTYEFRCVTNINNFDSLRELCEILAALGAKVNASCGLHVHLDMRDQGDELPQEIADRLEAAIPLMVAMQPKGRRANGFAKHRARHDHYSGVNLEAFNAYRTLEVRFHSGTTNFDKIANWCKVLYSIARGTALPSTLAKHTEAGEINVPALKRVLGWDAGLAGYVSKRITKFAEQTNGVALHTYRPEERPRTVGAQSLTAQYANTGGYSTDVEFEEVA